VSVTIFHTSRTPKIVDFFFSTDISYTWSSSADGPIIIECPELERELESIGISRDRYNILEAGVHDPSYSWLIVDFRESEDVVMLKLAFEQAPSLASTSVTKKFREIDRGTTI